MTAPALKVEIAWSVDPSSGPAADEYFVDESAYVRRVSIRRGASQDLGRVECSTCTIELDNRTGRFSPENTSGTHYPNVVPLRQVRLTETTATRSVWYGVIDTIDPTWWTPTGGVVALSCSDIFHVLAAATLPDVVCPQECAGARMVRLVDAYSLFGMGTSSVSGVTLSARTISGNLLEAMQEIAQTDGGYFWADRIGSLMFYERELWQTMAVYTISQVTFGDAGGSEIGYQSARFRMDEGLIYNYVTGSHDGVTQITPQEDATSQSRYLKRTYDLGTTYQESATELTARAADLCYQRKDARLRADSLSVELMDSRVTPSTLLDLDLFHRVTVIRRPDTGSAIQANYAIQGIDDDISPGSWRRSFRLSLAPDPYWLLGVDGVSELGQTTVLGA